MSSLVLNLLLQVSLVAGAPQPDTTYSKAYKQSQETGKPLLVLVGADWCPGCQTMKQEVIPALQAKGQLAGVELAIVNSDRESKLASQLMSGNSIPQLIVYYKDAGGWKRKQLTGAQAQATVRSLVTRAVQQTTIAKKVDQPAR